LHIFHETINVGSLKKYLFPDIEYTASQADLVLAFGHKDYFVPKFVEELRKRYPKSQIAGCSSSSEIVNGEFKYHSGVQITAIKFERGTKVRVLHGMLTEESIVRASQYLINKDLRCVLLLTDGAKLNSGNYANASIVIKTMRKILLNIPIFGGIASSDEYFSETVQLANNVIVRNSFVLVALYGKNLNIDYVSADGFSSYGPPKIITKANKNIVYEINNKPALPLYKMYIGKHATHISAHPEQNLLHPFMIFGKQNDSNKLQKIKIRSVMGIKDNYLIFGGEIDNNSIIRLCYADQTSLINAISDAAWVMLQKMANLRVANKSLLFCVSCIGRQMILADNTYQEVKILHNSLPDHVHVMGFYSSGEFCPANINNINTFHNQTMVMLHLCETK